jgi:hypothetical protein
MTHRALIAVLNHETELPVSFFAKDVVPDKPGRYTFRFFDWDSPDCEKVIVTYALAGQKDYLSVYDLDQQRGWIHNNPGTVWAKIVYHALANRKRRTVAA